MKALIAGAFLGIAVFILAPDLSIIAQAVVVLCIAVAIVLLASDR